MCKRLQCEDMGDDICSVRILVINQALGLGMASRLSDQLFVLGNSDLVWGRWHNGQSKYCIDRHGSLLKSEELLDQCSIVV